YVAWYVGYCQTGSAPGRHRGLPSPYVTFILTLSDPLEIAVHSDPRQRPEVYETLLGGLHTTPAIISHPGRQSGIQLALEPLGARALLGLPAAGAADTSPNAFVVSLASRPRRWRALFASIGPAASSGTRWLAVRLARSPTSPRGTPTTIRRTLLASSASWRAARPASGWQKSSEISKPSRNAISKTGLYDRHCQRRGSGTGRHYAATPAVPHAACTPHAGVDRAPA